MFGWFKQKKSDAERQAVIALAVLAIDPALKHVENFWLVGRMKEGDDLLRSVTAAVATRHAGKEEDLFYAFKSLVLFLQRHRKDELLRTVFNVVRAEAKVFGAEQLQWLMHQLEQWEIALHAKDGQSSKRLIYYVCQECGHPNLRSTEPCIKCGFSPTTEQQLRRAILLSSFILESHSLLAIAGKLHLSTVCRPRGPTLEQLWGVGDLDVKARECSKPYEGELGKLLSMCATSRENYRKPVMPTMTCRSCSKTFGIFPHRSQQECPECGSKMVAPTFRRLKATLSGVQEWMLLWVDHPEGAQYGNIIGLLTELTDNAMRRDTQPSAAQGRDLIARFDGIGQLSCKEGQYVVSFSGGVARGRTSSVSTMDSEFVDYADEGVQSLNNLFELLCATETAA